MMKKFFALVLVANLITAQASAIALPSFADAKNFATTKFADAKSFVLTKQFGVGVLTGAALVLIAAKFAGCKFKKDAVKKS